MVWPHSESADRGRTRRVLRLVVIAAIVAAGVGYGIANLEGGSVAKTPHRAPGATTTTVIESPPSPTTLLHLRRGYHYFILSERPRGGYGTYDVVSGVLQAAGISTGHANDCIGVAIEVLTGQSSSPVMVKPDTFPFKLGTATYQNVPCDSLVGTRYFAFPLATELNGDDAASTIGNVAVIGQTVQISGIEMRYTELSDTKIAWSEASDYLWVYDCNAVGGSGVLRIRGGTTALSYATIPMPPICRPLISADAKGFTLRPGSDTSTIGIATVGIYTVSPTSDQPVLVASCRSNGIRWLC